MLYITTDCRVVIVLSFTTAFTSPPLSKITELESFQSVSLFVSYNVQ